MAVAYPSEEDESVLVGFTEFFTQQEGVHALLRITEQDVQTVRSACSSVLAHLSSTSRLILASVPLNQAEAAQLVMGNNGRDTAYQVGSVYPHVLQHSSPMGYNITLSESAGAAPPLLHHPKSFLGSQLDAIDFMAAELESAKDTLLSLNARYAYLWTTNVDELRRYIAQDDRRQKMQQPMWKHAQMRAAPIEEETQKRPAHSPTDEVGLRDAAPQQGDAQGITERAPKKDPQAEAPSESSAQAPTYRTLLALDPSQLPSKQVQRSFMKFIQACLSLLEWTDSVLGLLSGRDDVPKAGTFEVSGQRESSQRRVDTAREASEQRPTNQATTSAGGRPGTKTVRVFRYEIRDVSHIYDMLYQQAECFYLPEYALYDARIKQRLLHPSYYYSLRILIEDATTEMTRLEHITASRADLVRADAGQSPFEAYRRGAFVPYPEFLGMRVSPSLSAVHDRVALEGGEPARIVFRPALPQFAFLRNTLRVLLSVCINEDDRTSFKRYEELYQTFVGSARDAVVELQHLPKPPPPLLEPAAQSMFGHRLAWTAGRPHFELVLVSDESSAQEARSGGKVAWVISAEDRGRLHAGFEAYWELRDGVHSLKLSLDKDIRRKDKTHRTRVLDACVAREKDLVAIAALERERELQEAELRSRRESGGWLGAARASLRSLAGIATCKAEVQMEDLGIPTAPERDDAGADMTTTSPYHAEKTLLQESVNRLWSAVEAHGVHMEREYPGLFYRSERQRWARRVSSLIEKVNAVGVVFSP
ncbi:conserved hypothetical protein [Leishmania major strain Friedlin]|uniref:Uncharacterized protein n=1 Tax=Leishmania major TaxID=5664 RepID=Q4QES3_LEIMA|nr:conserved hypothetical protein [Leishmania major strain Friedlin]CAG9572133.1 hypothetical_protein_-_conserved [Leishmania major strain Friedlin]CAJ03730.1 conserved hypothetical protein [Leishmania major strain Friedlin]|eukprot:XP_001682175.1 conserved hypothetical protein [Leishmania major strain Friedlin]